MVGHLPKAACADEDDVIPASAAAASAYMCIFRGTSPWVCSVLPCYELYSTLLLVLEMSRYEC